LVVEVRSTLKLVCASRTRSLYRRVDRPLARPFVFHRDLLHSPPHPCNGISTLIGLGGVGTIIYVECIRTGVIVILAVRSVATGCIAPALILLHPQYRALFPQHLVVARQEAARMTNISILWPAGSLLLAEWQTSRSSSTPSRRAAGSNVRTKTVSLNRKVFGR
jgi:hypothetical protein